MSLDNPVSVGFDPEFFLKNKRSGHFKSAHDIVPGTKLEPHPLKDGVMVQADGTAVEVNIPPSYSPEECARNIKSAITQVRALVPEELEFAFTPVADYTPAYFESIPQYALELGCDPDFSGANQGRMNPRPEPTGDMKYSRSGGGHIHVGFNNVKNPHERSHMWDCTMWAYHLDNAYRSFSWVFDDDERRSYLYGAGAAFRPKKYGFELRSPSNAWLKHEELWPWLFNVVQYVDEEMENGMKRGIPNYSYVGVYWHKYKQNPFAYNTTKTNLKSLLGDMNRIMKYNFPKFPKFPMEVFCGKGVS